MGMLPNTSSEQLNAILSSDFADIIKPQEGENIYRLVVGPSRLSQVWYPYHGKDKDDNPAVRFKALKVNPKNIPAKLKALASFDKALAAEELNDEDAKKYRSSWLGNSSFLYLGFDRISDERSGKIEPKFIQLPYSVLKALDELQSQVNNKTGNLRHGCIWMVDVIVTKTVDPKLSPAFGTKYSVTIDHESIPPVDVPTDANFEGFDFDAAYEGGRSAFFSEAEWKVMLSCDLDLTEFTKPQTEEEILETLSDNPPLINHTRKDGSPVFLGLSKLALPAYREEFEKLAEAVDFDSLEEDTDTEASPEKPPVAKKLPPQKPKKKLAIDAPGIEDAEVVDEPDAAEEKPTKRKVAKPVSTTTNGTAKKKARW